MQSDPRSPSAASAGVLAATHSAQSTARADDDWRAWPARGSAIDRNTRKNINLLFAAVGVALLAWLLVHGL
jgi:hypothetical protein